MLTPERLANLIEKYEAGTASPEELNQLNAWYHSFDDTLASVPADEPLDEKQLGERIRQRLMQTIRQEKVRRIPLYRQPRIRAAAVILVLLTAGLLFFLQNNHEQKPVLSGTPKTTPPAEVLPGGNKALLTLADGSTIILDSASNGLLSNQGNIRVEKLDNGLLAYRLNGKLVTEKDAAFYNTISTPRGGQYQVTLSDGTRVWLNAASSIRFPVMFTGAERLVEVTGETYFEVARNASRPFKVKAVNSVVEVLGTHFNINAYTDEASIRTTLLEGKVKVTAPGTDGKQVARFLQPGQQSGISPAGGIAVLSNADTEEAVAWIKGRFQFNSTDLRSILRQIARWYDVEVEYRGAVDLHFTGQLTRNEEVKKVFEKLALTGEVHFRLEGRKVIVTR